MRQRHKVLGLLGVLSVLTFLDRMAIAVAGPGIQAELHIQPRDWGWILSAYVLANGLFEIPSGMMGDARGQRGELTRIVTWWSAFTALTAWCRGFWQLMAVRFLFGMGAAGAYPNSAGVIARWFPARERARSQGFVWAASRLGGALAPLLIIPMQLAFGWRSVFWLLGLVGLVWAIVWYAWFRNYPADQTDVTAAELEEIGETRSIHAESRPPLRQLFRLRALWLIVLAYGCYGCGSWFYFSWFPIWLVHSAGFSLGGVTLASLPFLIGIGANLAGGVLGDRMTARLGAKTALRTITSVCLVLTSFLLAAMAVWHGKVVVVLLSSLGFGMMDLMLPSAWAMCLAIGGQASGTATGIMNTAGQAGGFLCTVLFGYIVQSTGSYNLPLWLIAAMVLISALIFSRIDCTQGLNREQDVRLV
ncbi:MAG TPA: MFS transporter [Terracidiphilus sp.]|nr:MFS transporter [Terracidiphilus sp.]HEV2487051.1 MFS transporter [Terracidiphilus sp.]